MKSTRVYFRKAVSLWVTVLLLLPTASAVADETIESEDDSMVPQRLGILGAEVFLYDVSLGGMFEYRDDWSKVASRNAVMSAALALKRMGYDPVAVPDAALTRDIFSLKAKMRYHCTAFRGRFYSDRSMYIRPVFASEASGGGSAYSSTLVDTVKYSIGSVDSLCNFYGVDGFVYVYGFQEGRFWRELPPNGAEAPPRRGIGGDRGKAYIAAILVRRDGCVLWHKSLAFTGPFDLRAGGYSEGIVGALFE
jgi:hypothetical protein